MQQRYYPIHWVALLLALCCIVGLPTALYAADEEETPPEPGVLIVAVERDGPAAAAGVARGDILLAIDGAPVNTMAELAAALATVAAKATVTLQIQHGDAVVELAVVTGVRDQHAYLGILPYGAPPAFTAPMPPRFPWAEQGATVQALPALPPAAPGMAFTTATAATNLVIVEVAEESAAAAAGLQVNDVITALNGEAVTAPQALRAHLAQLTPGDAITLTITRGEEAPMDVAVTVGEGEKGQALLGVKVGVVVTVEQGGEAGVQHHVMPTRPNAAPPMPFRHGMPPQPEQHFYRFQRALPLPFFFWVMPAPGFAPGMWSMGQWQPNQDFIQYQPGSIGVFSTPSGQMMAPPMLPGQQGVVTIYQGQPGQQMAQPAVPTEQETVTIYQGQPGQWMAQPAVPAPSFEWQEGSNPDGASEQEAGAYY